MNAEERVKNGLPIFVIGIIGRVRSSYYDKYIYGEK